MGSGITESTWVTTLVGWAAAAITTVALGAWKARGLQAVLEERIIEDDNRVRRDVGEGMAALRQKLVDIEMWNRDNFVRKEDFRDVISAFNRSVDSLRTTNQANFDRLSDKIDDIRKKQDN